MILPASEIAGLERIAARAWPAARETEIGDWRLYGASGFSGRINACWPLGDPGVAVAEAVARTEACYAEWRLPALFKIVDIAGAPTDLVGHLADRGYGPRTETVMMIGPAVGRPDGAVVVEAVLNEAFAAVFAAASSDPGDAQERLGALARVPRPRGFACVSLDGSPLAIGAAAVEGEWAGLFAMRTHPDHRRRGLARRVLSALLAWAAGEGVRRAWLQVEADNTAAVALYAEAGFEEAYRYRYWSR